MIIEYHLLGGIMEKLQRDFFLKNTLDIARDLLGKILVHHTDNGIISAMIVETEAYLGIEDKACHSYKALQTERNKVMYKTGGTAYVYLIYGMYHCFNIVTRDINQPEAILIRAVQPIDGLEIMAQNRYAESYSTLAKKKILNLTSGPGKLCKAMDITRNVNGYDLCGDKLYLCKNDSVKINVVETKRVNIDYAEEYIDKPWRFYIKDNKYVSRL